jgi:hypothetical protein
VPTSASGRRRTRFLPGEQWQASQGSGGLIGVRGRQHQAGPAIELGIVEVAERIVLAQQTEQPLSIRVAGPRMGSARASAQCDLPTG